MKLDRRNLRHWLLLCAFLAQGVVGMLARLLRRAKPEPVVILYGHKLNGNLKGLYDELLARGEPMKPVFLTMDRAYRDQLRSNGVAAQWACGWQGAGLLARASAVVSDHGLHAIALLLPVYRRLRMRFYDVWHGIPFKGFDGNDFRLQHQYDEIWVASDLTRDLYIRQFGFDPARVVATGYARTDRIVLRDRRPGALRSSIGLQEEGVVLLFAPTWSQDSKGRSIYPFGCSEHEFLGALASFATRYGATVVLRTHMNSASSIASQHPHILLMPATSHPDTEEILMASDILVCDWSSIAFDFLLLDRPTFFLDVPAPFKKGFSLGPQYRFGPVVPNLESLLHSLVAYIGSPDAYWAEYSDSHISAKAAVYGNKADGAASARCIERLLAPDIRAY